VLQAGSRHVKRSIFTRHTRTSSLGIGAFVGVFWQPSRKISAAIMAFGSGTLLCAIAFEIKLPTY
jgi:hypothetical protein